MNRPGLDWPAEQEATQVLGQRLGADVTFVGSFCEHLRQIAFRTRGTLGLKRRGGTGSCKSTCSSVFRKRCPLTSRTQQGADVDAGVAGPNPRQLNHGRQERRLSDRHEVAQAKDENGVRLANAAPAEAVK
jgi:hypothetical protein